MFDFTYKHQKSREAGEVPLEKIAGGMVLILILILARLLCTVDRLTH